MNTLKSRLFILPLLAAVIVLVAIFLNRFWSYMLTHNGLWAGTRGFTILRICLAAATFLAAFLFIAFLGHHISRYVSRALSTLREGAEALTEGNFTHQTLLNSNDELGDLSRTFNNMTANLAEYHRHLEEEIAHRKVIQQSLLYSDKKYRNLFELIQDPLIVVDLNTFRIDDANRAAVNTFGYPREEFFGMRVEELGSGGEKKKILDNVSEFSRGEVLARKIYSRVYTRKDGTTFPAEITVSTLTVEGKHKLIASIRDVTERRELEATLQHSEKLESLGVLAGGIAHDFNNLLMGVMGHAGMAHMKLPHNSPAMEDIYRIERAAGRLKDLTEKLLAYSGRGKFESGIVDLSTVVREISTLLQAAVPKEIEVKYELYEKELIISGDSAQLSQVFMNLIMNAAEACVATRGRVLVLTGIKRFTAGFLSRSVAAPGLKAGTYVYFTVTDTGHGIEKRDMPNIFDPFFTSKNKGRGLGLAAVLGIIKAHDGGLVVKTRVGEGTTFTALIPAHEHDGTSIRKESEKRNTALRPLNILVVDDEEIVREVTEAILVQAGMKVELAANGQEAIEKYKAGSEDLDLVLMDLSMPVMGGEEAYRELHRIKEDVRVIFTSGYDEADSMAGLWEGKVAFIKKPYTPIDLVSKVRDMTNE